MLIRTAYALFFNWNVYIQVGSVTEANRACNCQYVSVRMFGEWMSDRRSLSLSLNPAAAEPVSAEPKTQSNLTKFYRAYFAMLIAFQRRSNLEGDLEFSFWFSLYHGHIAS